MKKIFKITYVLVALGFSLLISSCTEKIDFPLDDNGKVQCVIYGAITTDTTAHKIRISKTATYYSNKPVENISGAVVTISDGTKTFTLTESPTEPGNYFTEADVYGEPGKTYTLNVSNVNLLGDGVMHSYTAYSELKPVSPLDSIDTKYNSRFEYWETDAWAKDPSTEDYYMFKAYIDGVLNSDSLLNLTITDDLLFNGSKINGKMVYVFPEKDTIKPGQSIVTIDICGITKDYFKFLTEAQTMARPQNPMFSGPPANVRTNLSNNALGFFTAYSVAKCSSIVRIK